jgi:Uma2 family endonuclease
VAETSAEIERSDTVPRYGRSGVPEAWVVDLGASQVDVYRVATSDGYVEHETMVQGGKLRPRGIPSIELSIDRVMI